MSILTLNGQGKSAMIGGLRPRGSKRKGPRISWQGPGVHTHTHNPSPTDLKKGHLLGTIGIHLLWPLVGVGRVDSGVGRLLRPKPTAAEGVHPPQAALGITEGPPSCPPPRRSPLQGDPLARGTPTLAGKPFPLQGLSSDLVLRPALGTSLPSRGSTTCPPWLQLADWRSCGGPPSHIHLDSSVPSFFKVPLCLIL